MLLTTQVFANTYSTDIDAQRAKNIDAIIQRENELYNLARLYVLEEGDLTPTRNEISQYFDIDYTYWTNYAKSECQNDGTYCINDTSGGITFTNDNANNRMTFGNVLGTDPSLLVNAEISRYAISEKRHTRGRLTADKLGRVILHDDTLRHTIALGEKIDADVSKYKGATAPADVSKAWYKPNGADGGYEVFYYNMATTQWESRGVIGAGAYTESDGGMLTFKVDDGFDAETTAGNLGDRARVEENDVWNEYQHNGTKWLLVSGGGGSGIDGQIIAEVGDLDYILDRDEDNKYFNAGSSSSFRVTHSVFKGGQTNVDFRRYVKYWVTDTPIEVPNYRNKNIGYYSSLRNVYVTDNIDQLGSCVDGDVAFLKGNSVWEADTKDTATPQYEAICLNTMWYKSVPTLQELVDKATTDDKWFVVETGQTFENSKAVSTMGYWHSNFTVVNYLSLNSIRVTKGDRRDLEAPSNANVINLTASFGSDPAYTTTGVSSSYPYHGGYFLQWFYSTTGTIVNRLLDAWPTTNAYTDATAISFGYAIQGGVVLQKCSSHWCRIGTSQVVNSSLSNGTTGTVVAIGATNTTTNCSTTFTQSTQIAGQNNLGSGNCNKAPNGLFYDGCEGGSNTWNAQNPINFCANKGMRLPTADEAGAWSASGVPSCVGWTWSATKHDTSSYPWNLWVWSGNGTMQSLGNSTTRYVRCVR